jgi:hypothetical protein
MNAMRTLVAAGLLSPPLLGAAFVAAYPPEIPGLLPTGRIVSGGEELTYEVSWSFITLGTVRLVTRDDYSATAYIDSDEGTPVVDLHAVFTTRMDSLFRSVTSRSVQLTDEGWKGLDYRYDHDRGKVFIDKVLVNDPHGEPVSRTPSDTLELPGPDFVDGLSIAMYPRRYVHTKRRIDVPTILYGKLGVTTFDFRGDEVEETLDAVSHLVRMQEVAGATTVVGVFGMTGDFTGWFSDDSSAVPLRGKLKVLIGNVDLQLVRWKKPGWNPPAS